MTLSRRSLLFRMLPVAFAAGRVDRLTSPHSRASDSALFTVSRLTIETRQGQFGFDVEIAATPVQRQQGLQNRRNLPEATGMLFDFHRPQPVTMWMKDTYVPLDMMFIDERGIVVAVAENTTPLSLTPVESGSPVRAVLEVRAGTAARLGVRVGDHVRHPIFKVSGD